MIDSLRFTETSTKYTRPHAVVSPEDDGVSCIYRLSFRVPVFYAVCEPCAQIWWTECKGVASISSVGNAKQTCFLTVSGRATRCMADRRVCVALPDSSCIKIIFAFWAILPCRFIFCETISFICLLQLGWRPVAAVTYMYTNKLGI